MLRGEIEHIAQQERDYKEFVLDPKKTRCNDDFIVDASENDGHGARTINNQQGE